MLRRTAAALLATGLAAFFAFVGWNKAFAPLADLARYHAWTVYIPEPLGRAVGWSEMVLAAVLLGALIPTFWRVARVSSLLLVLNQFVAALVHITQEEVGALPQNAVLIAALMAVVALLSSTSKLHRKENA